MEDSRRKDDEGTHAPQKPGSIVVGELDLVIPKIGTIAKRDIRKAYVDDRPGQPSRVVINTSRWRRAIWIMVDTPEQGDELVAALGFTPRRPAPHALRSARTQYVSSLSFGSHVAVAYYVILVVGIAAAIIVPLRLEVALLVMLGVGIMVAILIGAARPWLTIGPNGVTFHRGLSRAPLSFAEVDSIGGRRAIVEDDSRPSHLRIAADIVLSARNDEDSIEERLAELAELDKGAS